MRRETAPTAFEASDAVRPEPSGLDDGSLPRHERCTGDDAYGGTAKA